jgi:hypothetical protein
MTTAPEQQARQAARRIGLIAMKCRIRTSEDPRHGGFTIIDENNRVIAGENFDLSPEQVIDICDAERTGNLPVYG